ncbi:MAG: hypothetical protein KatS3mg002_0819 [Candidatus Woesearchaeota archaeon]|nr:MAG: hypothetical protein KatS3mg002_0819 [Candidatus Woesearchaeota archaeon]
MGKNIKMGKNNYVDKNKISRTRKILYLVFVLFLLQIVQFAFAAPSLKASLSKYEPYPAAPGDTVKVWLLVQNVASNDNTDTAKNVVVELIPSFPFSVYNDQEIKTIPLLGAKKDYLIDFNLKVDEKAVQGYTDFKVRVKDSNSNVQVEETISLFIQSRDTTIAIDSVKIVPESIAPGSSGKIYIIVKNIASNSFTDLSLKLNLQSVIGGTIIDLPFAPIGSSTEKRIYRLGSGQTAEFSYDIVVYPNAESKIYKIPFVLEYYDTLGTKRNKSDVIGITVSSVPELSAILDRTDINSDRLSGTVSLKIINKGLGDIKFLNAILQNNESYEILSESNVNYIGNLESDDYQTIDYKISVMKGVDRIVLPLKLEYRDATNKYYETTINIPLQIVESKKINKVNGKGTSIMIFIVIILILVAAWIFYKRTRKNKKGWI